MKQIELASGIRQVVYFFRQTVYGLLRQFDCLFGLYNPIVILTYHAIADDHWRYSTKKNDFISHIRHLKNVGYTFVSTNDLQAYLAGRASLPKKSAIVHFDDGYKDILVLRDFIRSEQLRPTVFILSDKDNASRAELETDRAFLTDDDIRSLLADGWIIGSHGATHRSILDLTLPEIQNEIYYSKQVLEQRFVKPVLYFAYPKGMYTSEAISTVEKAQYGLAFSMDDGIISRNLNQYAIFRVGVDNTYSVSAFPALYTPSVIFIRRKVKRWLGWSGVQPAVSDRS